jgi:RNA-splicing ligase RtcB
VKQVTERLYSWASDIEPDTLAQAEQLSRLPIIEGHVALMSDAHLGIGSTVGSVIPTKGAVIPAAVGVDIGCGMIAAQTSLHAEHLPDDLAPFIDRLEKVVPAGLGKWHQEVTPEAAAWMQRHSNPMLTVRERDIAAIQLGTMGSGNHFFEVCLDQQDRVWIIMHSGSRGVGNRLANRHMKVAKELCAAQGIPLEHPDLAYLQEGTEGFDAYILDMRWSQGYAMENRRLMMRAALDAFFEFTGGGQEQLRVNCHHNFTEQEEHGGQTVWVTRKGAIRATPDDLGLIPGAMGSKSYVIRGKGNPASYNSCAHGAGRRMSRRKARESFTVEDLTERMGRRAWQAKEAASLLDEHPLSYKDIDQVMADQDDLVAVLYELRGIANYKGVETPWGKRASKRHRAK